MTDLRAAVQQALEQPEQTEPVGEVYRHGKDSHGRQWHGIHWYDPNVDVPTGTKLFTHPPRRETERPNLLGWSFRRNSDGSIGIKSPPPKPGESKRTGESVYPTDGGGLHELLSKFVDQINADNERT
jgi:hypothetical protein